MFSNVTKLITLGTLIVGISMSMAHGEEIKTKEVKQAKKEQVGNFYLGTAISDRSKQLQPFTFNSPSIDIGSDSSFDDFEFVMSKEDAETLLAEIGKESESYFAGLAMELRQSEA